MIIWKKLTRWETNIEKAPKKDLVRVLVLFFSGSLILGILISVGIRTWQAKAYGGIIQDIHTAEYREMNARLEELTKVRYGLTQK